jgi:hypothetical protein
MRASTDSDPPFPWLLRLHVDATSHEALVADLHALAKALATPDLSRVDFIAILEALAPRARIHGP